MKLTWIVPCLLTALVVTANAQKPTSTLYKDPKQPVEKRVEDLLGQMTLEEKISMMAGTGYMDLAKVDRLGIPAFKLTDGPEGTRCYGPSTAYANGVALASTWDRDLAHVIGVSLGRDARSRGVNILLAPGMNLYRAPMNGRNFEYLGEDPLLAGQIASEYINGVQSQGVGVTAKHFAGNEQEFSRHELSTNVDERTLRELYLKPFQIVVKNGALGIMTSYNPLNGIHASQNDWLINKVLKGEWNFQGLVMSDWGSTYDAKEMANGGLDLEMPVGKFYNMNTLKPLLDAGIVKQEVIDDKVRRILRVAFTLGWFDRPQLDVSIGRDDQQSSDAALRGARECITLLKNKGNLLPLDPAKTKKVVLLGHNAWAAATGGNGSAFTDAFHAPSLYEGVRAFLGADAEVTLVPWSRDGTAVNANGASPKNGASLPPIPDGYVDAVKNADVVVVACGFFPFNGDWGKGAHPDSEGEGGDRTYDLPPGQEEVIKAVAALNPKTIVILNAGGSVATAGWIDKVPAFIDAYYPGQAGGTALAEVLFGKTNPSGKIAFSWEKRWEDSAAYGNYPTEQTKTSNEYKEGVFAGYRWFDSKKDREPLFPFGFGLSYTTFEYNGLKISEPAADGKITATVTIKNTGKTTGAEIAELYVEPPKANVPRPVRELKGFARVELQPGESKEATITFTKDDLAYWDPETKKWTVTPGDYTVKVGGSSRDLPTKADIKF